MYCGDLSLTIWDAFSPPTNKTSLIIQELLATEENYVSTLKRGVDSYIAKFDSHPLPDSLKDQRRNLFGNIEVIYAMHANKILPRFRKCGSNPVKVAKTFLHYLDTNQLDAYITYGLNRKRASELCIQHKDFFTQMNVDKFGIDSFLHEPLQRLPRYQLLLERIINDLTKDLDNNKEAVASCCVAEKKIQWLLQKVNDFCARQWMTEVKMFLKSSNELLESFLNKIVKSKSYSLKVRIFTRIFFI